MILTLFPGSHPDLATQVELPFEAIKFHQQLRGEIEIEHTLHPAHCITGHDDGIGITTHLSAQVAIQRGESRTVPRTGQSLPDFGKHQGTVGKEIVHGSSPEQEKDGCRDSGKIFASNGGACQ